MVEYCAHCGEEVSPQSAFCGNCGEQLTDSQAQQGNAGGWDSGGQQQTGQQNAGWGETQQRGQQRGGPQVPRKGAIGTISEAFNWALSEPALIALFTIPTMIGLIGTFFFPVRLVGFVVSPIIGGLAHLTAAEKLRRENTSLQSKFNQVTGQLPSMIGAGFITGVATVIGMIFLVIPGVYISLRLSLAIPACVIDRKGVGDSLKTSWEVAPGNLLKIFGVQLLVAGITLGAILVPVVAGAATLSLSSSPAALLPYAAVATLIAALPATMGQLAFARIYLENRHKQGRQHQQPPQQRAPERGGYN